MAEALTQSALPSGFTGQDRPSWELYSVCIHCGLCLSHCPTYRVLGMEMDSPRGRIYQVLQVDAGRMPLGESFVTHIDRCLDCRACETACPSGVSYGRIVERARAQIEAHYRRRWMARRLRDYFYGKVLVEPNLLKRWAKMLRLYQRSGLQKLARASGVLKLMGMSSLESLAPVVDEPFFLNDVGKLFPAEGERRGRVAMLAGCIGGVSFGDLDRATVRVLNKNGIEVVLAPGQACCGALHAHAGYRDLARQQARRNIDAFLAVDCDAVVTNAAGCGSTMKEYGDLLGEDPAYREKAREFSARMRDVTEYLAEIGLRTPTRRLERKVTYQDPCHLAHGQRIRSAPRELIRLTGAELIEMPHADYCCGSAGTYNVAQHQLSMQILDAKMKDIGSTGAEVVATANVGCMLQLRAGVVARGLKMEVRHVIELMDEAYSS